MPQALWHAVQWLLWPYHYFEEQAQKQGLTWRAPLPGLGQVLISGDPAILSEIRYHPLLEGGKAHRALRACLGPDHLIVMWGPQHQQRRQLIQKALKLPPTVPEVEMAQITRAHLKAAMDQAQGAPFSLAQVSLRASRQIFLRALLGTISQETEEQLTALCDQFTRSFSNPLPLFLRFLQRDWNFGPWKGWSRLLKSRSQLKEALCHEAHQHPNPGTIADYLRHHLPSTSFADELLALLFFGHETTAASLNWCLQHALVRPHLLQRIKTEPSYAQAFIAEVLRVSPSVGQLTRIARADLCLGQHRVPQGSVVMPAIPLAHTQIAPREDFCPERFLGSAPHSSQYCPFGLGNRLCPGKDFALTQMQVMLTTILSGSQLQLQEKTPLCEKRDLFLMVAGPNMVVAKCPVTGNE